MTKKVSEKPAGEKNVGLHIGAGDKAVAEMRHSIMSILNSGQEQKTIRAAIRALENVCSVHHVSISDCSIVAGKEHD